MAPSGPFSRLARAAVFRGDDPPNPPRGPASCTHFPPTAFFPCAPRGSLWRPCPPSAFFSPRPPRPVARSGCSAVGLLPAVAGFPFCALIFSPRVGSRIPVPTPPRLPRSAFSRSVRAAPPRPGARVAHPCAHDLGPTGACRDYHCRCSSGGKSPTPVAAPAQPTPRDPAAPPAQASGWAGRRRAPWRSQAHRSCAANPTRPSRRKRCRGQKDPRPRGGVRERGCSGGRAGNGQAVDSSLGAAWEGEPAVPVSSRPTSDDDGSGRGRARCR